MRERARERERGRERARETGKVAETLNLKGSIGSSLRVFRP